MKPRPDFPDSRVKYETWLLLLFSVFIFLIYSNTLTGPFIFDDRPNIQQNPKIRLKHLSVPDLLTAGFESPSRRRPVSNISFALNYLFHGYNVVGYHFVNILIHIFNSVLFYFLAKTTLNSPGLRRRYDQFMLVWIPFFAAFIWGLHPLQTQSVSYIVQRMNSLATLFYVLSILLYAKGRLTENRVSRRWLLAGCAASGIIAFGTKENTATLPFFILLYEWYFLQGFSNLSYKKKSIVLGGVLVFLILLTLYYLDTAPIKGILASYTIRDYTVGQRLLTQFRVVIFYLSLIFWPHPSRLNIDHAFEISQSLFDPMTTVFALVGIAGAVAAAIYLAKKAPLISFGILWFFGHLVIESSVIGLEIIFEHRTYLPSMMFILMLVSIAFKTIRPKWLCVALLSIFIVAGSIGTYVRNQAWTSAVAIWQDSVSKSPQKARPYNNLGVALATAGRVEEAYQMYRRALQIKPDYATAHYNLGYTLARHGHLDEGLIHLRESLRLNPNDKEAHNDIGIALVMQGRLNEAVHHFRKALQLSPTYSRAHNNLGIALGRQDKLTKAIYHYQEALRLDPEYAEAHNNLGLALQRQGKFEAAHHHFDKALRIDPDFATARKNYMDNQKNLK
ncbi:MAG: tetratricopeptide repeat protein [Desulfobacterales bacterium]|jgi:Flp pilus assembly protein TadD